MSKRLKLLPKRGPVRTRLAVAILLVLVSLVASATTAAGQRQQGTIMHWTIDGVQRDALVFAPHTTQGAAKHPLVIAFHGHGGGMLSTSARMQFQTLWPQAIVVYPQGLNTPTPVDPAGTLPGWQGKAGDFGDRDLKLFDAIVKTMKQSYVVDKRRIYATGFSNGAVFSFLLWAERAKTIAAIGEVAGELDPAETLTSPRALLAVAGRSDMVAPFAVQKQSIQQALTGQQRLRPRQPVRPVLHVLPVDERPGPGQDLHPPGRPCVPGLGVQRDRQVLQVAQAALTSFTARSCGRGWERPVAARPAVSDRRAARERPSGRRPDPAREARAAAPATAARR